MGLHVVASLLRVERVSDELLTLYRSWLGPDEIAAAARHADPRTFIAARALARWALSQATKAKTEPAAWTFQRTEAGKPFVTGLGERPELNLSHTDGLVACVVGSVPVGIDVEPLVRGDDILDTVRRAFAPSERVGLNAPRAVELWTVKEAYLKGLGTGISRHLDRFEVHKVSEDRWEVPENSEWNVTTRTFEGRWAVAVATPPSATIAFRDVLPT